MQRSWSFFFVLSVFVSACGSGRPSSPSPEPRCGNGVRERGEQCDGVALGGATCTVLGFTSGALACAATCDGYDTSGCISDLCGNGNLDPGELCDDLDLGGEECATVGYYEGTLLC